MVIKLINTRYFEILDEKTNKISYGCQQEWYKSLWQRKSGCGPTVASNIILYLKQKNNIYSEAVNKKNCLLLMEDVWKHVTPTLMGVNTTKIFIDGMNSYGKLNKLNMNYDFIDIPKGNLLRPEFINVIKLLKSSLENDLPLAFLNLCNGDEKCLDKWHWVTIISLEYKEDNSSAFVEILDEGIIKKIDILLWYKTTTLGGGFVSFNF